MTDEQIQIITGWMAPMTAKEALDFTWVMADVVRGALEAICETEGHHPDTPHPYCNVCDKKYDNQ